MAITDNALGMIETRGFAAMVEASDALRLALMYKYGGMYLDTDIITMQVTTIDS